MNKPYSRFLARCSSLSVNTQQNRAAFHLSFGRESTLPAIKERSCGKQSKNSGDDPSDDDRAP